MYIRNIYKTYQRDIENKIKYLLYWLNFALLTVQTLPEWHTLISHQQVGTSTCVIKPNHITFSLLADSLILSLLASSHSCPVSWVPKALLKIMNRKSMLWCFTRRKCKINNTFMVNLSRVKWNMIFHRHVTKLMFKADM